MEYEREDLIFDVARYYDSIDHSILRRGIYKNATCCKNSKGLLHNLFGPALIQPLSNKWYINGYDVTDKIYDWAADRNIDLTNLSDFDKDVIKLEWASYDGQKQ